MKIAVFDLDRTLIKGTSAEFILIRFLKQKGMITNRNLFRMITFIFRHLEEGVEGALFKNRAYLTGLREDEIKSMLPELWRHHLLPSLSEKIVKRFRDLKKQGFYIVLLSGAIDFLLDLFHEYLEADRAIGARAEVENGVFTGRLLFHPYFWNKLHIFNDLISGMNVDLEESYMFADSITDIPLLKRSGHPVAVHPKLPMYIFARSKGWPVIQP